jgi:hypothetical protein
VLVLVGVVVTLGLLAVTLITDSASSKADKQAACMQSMSCAAGSGGDAPGAALAGVPVTGGDPTPAPASTDEGGIGSWFASGVGLIESGASWVADSAVGRATYGFGAEGYDAVAGVVTAVRHPVQTYEGIKFAVNNPGQVWDALKQEWSGRSTAENVGRALFEVVTLVTPAAASKFGKAAEVAGTAGELAAGAERLAASTEAAAVARNAAAAAEVEDVAAVAVAASTRKVLGEGAFSIAYLEGDTVVKEIKTIVKGVGDVPVELDAAGRARLASTTVEVTNELADKLGGGVIPAMTDAGNGVIRQPLAQGMTLEELRNVDVTAWLRAGDEMRDMTFRAAKAFELDGPEAGFLETPDGWHILVDTNPANFRFDAQGNVVSWFDPIAVFPAK